MINEKNIFEKGILIAIHTGQWSGRKKLDKEDLHELPTEIVRGVHDLFDKDFKEILNNIWSFDGETRGTIKNMCVPFIIDGFYFLPSEKIGQAIEYLEDAKVKHHEMAMEATEQYEEAINAFAQKYPTFYAKAKGKYPSKSEFAASFRLEYQMLKVAPPSEDIIINPEVYQREMTKFKESIQDMKNDVLGTIAQILLEMTERLKSQCTDGKPNQRTFNNLNKFLLQIDEVYSDFIDREDIRNVVEKVKSAISGVGASNLRNSEDFKKEFRDLIGEAANAIQTLPNIPSKRAIDF
jgi:hypothetical protein